MRLDPAIIDLRERVEELEEAIRQLYSGVVLTWDGLHVTPGERVVLTAIVDTPGICSNEHLLNRLQVRTRRQSHLSPKLIDVHIFRLRKKLKSLSPPIGIITAYRVGYWMDADSRARLEARRVKSEGNSQ